MSPLAPGRPLALGPALLLCVSCAPLSSFRPASGLSRGRSVEVGSGATVVSSRPFVTEPARVGGQAWAMTEVGGSVGLSFIGAFDDDALGLGLALRVNVRRAESFAAAVEAELGYGWAAFSVPLALRMWDESWAYAAPRIGTWGIEPLVALPVGASFHFGEGVFVRAEAQGSLQSFALPNRRFLFGLAAAHQR